MQTVYWKIYKWMLLFLNIQHWMSGRIFGRMIYEKERFQFIFVLIRWKSRRKKENNNSFYNIEKCNCIVNFSWNSRDFIDFSTEIQILNILHAQHGIMWRCFSYPFLECSALLFYRNITFVWRKLKMKKKIRFTHPKWYSIDT